MAILLMASLKLAVAPETNKPIIGATIEVPHETHPTLNIAIILAMPVPPTAFLSTLWLLRTVNSSTLITTPCVIARDTTANACYKGRLER